MVGAVKIVPVSVHAYANLPKLCAGCFFTEMLAWAASRYANVIIGHLWLRLIANVIISIGHSQLPGISCFGHAMS